MCDGRTRKSTRWRTYNEYLYQRIREEFKERNYAGEFLKELRRSLPNVLPEAVIANLLKNTDSKGHLGNDEILDELKRKPDMFDIIIKILSIPEMCQKDLAKDLTRLKEELDADLAKKEAGITSPLTTSGPIESFNIKQENVTGKRKIKQDSKVFKKPKLTKQAKKKPMPSTSSHMSSTKGQREGNKKNKIQGSNSKGRKKINNNKTVMMCEHCVLVIKAIARDVKAKDQDQCITMRRFFLKSILNLSYLKTRKDEFCNRPIGTNKAKYRLACLVYKDWLHKEYKLTKKHDTPVCVRRKIGERFPVLPQKLT